MFGIFEDEDQTIETLYGVIPKDANGVYRYIRSNMSFVYIGEIKDGRIHGKGRSVKTSKNSLIIKKGDFVEGFFRQGEMICDKKVYTGSFVNGELLHDFKGTVKDLNKKTVFTGSVVNGLPDECKGEILYDYDSKFETVKYWVVDYSKQDILNFTSNHIPIEYNIGKYNGMIEYGKPNGEGVYTSGDSVWIGYFINGDIARGTQLIKDVYYRGTFKDWKFIDGIVQYPNKVVIGKETYEDMYIKNKDKDRFDMPIIEDSINLETVQAKFKKGVYKMDSNICGRYKVDILIKNSPNNKSGYIGDVYMGKFHGVGNMYSKNRNIYGLFKDGQLVKGVIKKSGITYKGEFKDNVLHGRAEIIGDGFIFKGRCSMGEPVYEDCSLVCTKGSCNFMGTQIDLFKNRKELVVFPKQSITFNNRDDFNSGCFKTLTGTIAVKGGLINGKTIFLVEKIEFEDGCTVNKNDDFKFPEEDEKEIVSKWAPVQLRVFLLSIFPHFGEKFHTRLKHCYGQDFISILERLNKKVVPPFSFWSMFSYEDPTSDWTFQKWFYRETELDNLIYRDQLLACISL